MMNKKLGFLAAPAVESNRVAKRRLREIFTVLLFFGGILFVLPVPFLVPGFLEVEIKFVFLGRPGRAPPLVDVALQQFLQAA